MSLAGRVVQAGVWVFAVRIAQKIFNLIRLIVLARLLAPQDFGVFGIALLTMSAMETLSITGFQQALIQKKEDIYPFLNSAWTLLVLRGMVLFSLLYLFAPAIAALFNTPAAKQIIQVIGFSILLQAFTNIGIIYFSKELEFKKQFIYQLSAAFADFVIAVSAAVVFRNAWALVFGVLAREGAGVIASYCLHSYRPRIDFNLEKIRKLFQYGKWVLGSSILGFFNAQGDDLVVGKLLGATALGFYQMAYKISNLPAIEITHVISQVMLPAYAKLQDRAADLKTAYFKALRITAFLSFPFGGMILMLAADFTRMFLGVKWMPMVLAMQILVLWGWVRSIGATCGPLFYGVGKPQILTKIQTVQLILLAVLIFPFTTQGGIAGTAIAVVLATFIPNIVVWYKAAKVVREDFCVFIRMLVIPLVNVIISILLTLALKQYFVRGLDLLVFMLQGVIFVLFYSMLAFAAEKVFNYGMWDIVQEIRKRLATGRQG
ncbi:MAG: lipopolysaccharide biosynthesis protein [Candidatus Omnitrophota bacterium]